MTLSTVKAMIPVDCNDYDSEISLLISAANADLHRAGVNVELGGSLIDLAIATYVKMHFHNPPDYEQLKKAYESLLSSLRFSSDYSRGDDG